MNELNTLERLSFEIAINDAIGDLYPWESIGLDRYAELLVTNRGEFALIEPFWVIGRAMENYAR